MIPYTKYEKGTVISMVDEIINEFYDKEHHYGYDYVYNIDHTPQNDDEFMLHNHNDRYEIVLFLTGNAEFHIEGNIYRSHPHDIFLARPLEMHHNYFLSSEKYTRVVIHIQLDFFEKNHCKELEEVFLNRTLGVDCQIPARIVDVEMYHLIMKINQYLLDGAYEIAKCVLLEFLYLLNQIKEPLTTPIAAAEHINSLLLYINENLDSQLTLDRLAAKSYMNKYHLCRTFKKVTGYTINHYINYKRLLLAKELHSKGQTLLEASTNAGFNNYAHFYRMYRKEFGISPRTTN